MLLAGRLDPGFDKSKIKVYGLGLDGASGGGNGQTQWSMYTGSNNWNFTDKNDNADALFVFHREVEAARKKLAEGYAPVR